MFWCSLISLAYRIGVTLSHHHLAHHHKCSKQGRVLDYMRCGSVSGATASMQYDVNHELSVTSDHSVLVGTLAWRAGPEGKHHRSGRPRLPGLVSFESPYKFIGFGDIYGPNPNKFIGFGDIYGPKPYKCNNTSRCE